MQTHDRSALQQLLALPTLPKLPQDITRALEPARSRLAIGPFRRNSLPDSAATQYEVWRSRFQRAATDDREEVSKYLDSLSRDADHEKHGASFLRHRAQIKSTLQCVVKALEGVSQALAAKPMQSSLRSALEDTKASLLLTREDLARAEEIVRELETSGP